MMKLGKNKQLKRLFRTAKKQLPSILTGIGIAGGITATVLAVKETPKAIELIDEAKREKATQQLREMKEDATVTDLIKSTELTPVETVQAVWKVYIPSFLIGSASVACLIGANSVHASRHAALYSAYKLSETALSEYKDKVKEVLPEKKVKEIKQKIAEDKVDKAIVNEPSEIRNNVIVAGDGDIWFIDPFSNQEFLSTTVAIREAIVRLNNRMRTEMFVSLTDLYDEIDNPRLCRTATSDNLGWCVDDGDIYLDPSDAIVRNGKAYIIMDFMKRPEYGYDDKSKYYA